MLHPLATDAELENACKNWFRHVGDRLKRYAQLKFKLNLPP